MDQEGILVGKRMEFEHQIISDFLSRKMSRVQASEMLGVEERTISRKARRLEEKGLTSLVHGNRKRAPSNKILGSEKLKIMKLVESRYFDFNMTHCLEILKAEHDFKNGYDTLRRWSHEKHLVKRKKRRRSKPRKYRDRMECEGLLLQFDGSPHRWNGKDEWCLIGAIDDATSKIPYAEFFLSEDTLSCMTVMQKIIEKNGIPYSVYVDRAGWFGGQKRQNFAQFKRACEELDINVIFANSPQAKGRIERAWDTIQDRLIPEMRIRKIHRMPAANHYLQHQFLAGYWEQKNTVVPRSLEVKYRKLPPKRDLNEIFCTKEYRIVKSDHTISWHGDLYQLDSPLKYSIQRQEIELRTYQDLTWCAYFAGKKVKLEIIILPVKTIIAA
jgi:transposase